MYNPQAKYFALLHTSKKTPYTDGKTLVFSNIVNEFTSGSFADIEKKLYAQPKDFWLGYLGYDLKNSIEQLAEDEEFFIKTPKSWFGNFSSPEIKENFQLPSLNYELPKISYVKSNMSKAQYLSKVFEIKDHIKAGDIYQANLTRKFYGEFAQSVEPFKIYSELNRISPAPYSAYLKINDLHIISSSPELFIRVDDKGNAITCPIKGSAEKGQGKELSLSEKDRAENLMITDLMRNDLARACTPGSVKVDDLFEISEFENISHMYSTILGKLAEDTKPIELIKNCFPPGSMTGAPKINAMKICSELEKHKRGIYSGALGYFDLTENARTACEFSVIIRTIIIQGNKFEFQVGGGIVFDSEPEKEWAETMLKAQAIAKVLGVEEQLKNL